MEAFSESALAALGAAVGSALVTTDSSLIRHTRWLLILSAAVREPGHGNSISTTAGAGTENPGQAPSPSTPGDSLNSLSLSVSASVEEDLPGDEREAKRRKTDKDGKKDEKVGRRGRTT